MNRRDFLKVFGIGGLLFGLENEVFGKLEQESRKELIKRIYNNFPDDANEIPGAGRINKEYSEDSQHILICIDQRRYGSNWRRLMKELFENSGLTPTCQFMACLRDEQQRVEQVQNEVRQILNYLISNDSENTPYFPKNNENKRVVYAQDLRMMQILSFLKGLLRDERGLEIRQGRSIPNPASKALDALQEYVKQINEQNLMAMYHLKRDENFSLQTLYSARSFIAEFENDTPTVTAVYSIESSYDDRRRYNCSLIEIIPTTMAQQSR